MIEHQLRGLVRSTARIIQDQLPVSHPACYNNKAHFNSWSNLQLDAKVVPASEDWTDLVGM